MGLEKKTVLYSARNPDECNRLKISEGVWECLRKGPCKFSYCYGGDVFCKHPITMSKERLLTPVYAYR